MVIVEHIVVTLGTEVIFVTRCNIGNCGHCRLTTVTTNRIITTVTLDTVVAFETIVAFVLPFE
jgi:hypothetical protein